MGWLDEIGNLPEQGLYFVYCRGYKPSNRYYLDVETGTVFTYAP